MVERKVIGEKHHIQVNIDKTSSYTYLDLKNYLIKECDGLTLVVKLNEVQMDSAANSFLKNLMLDFMVSGLIMNLCTFPVQGNLWTELAELPVQQLDSLKVIGLELTASHVNGLSTFLRKHSISHLTLSKLTLEGSRDSNNHSDLLSIFLSKLGETIALNPTIKTLKFNKNYLGKDISHFLDPLARSTSITELNLTYNDITDLKVLEKVCSVDRLQRLVLDYNNLRGQDSLSFFNSILLSIKNLKSLSLKRTMLETSHVKSLLTSLKKTNIEQLNLSFNEITSDIGDSLEQFLIACRTIKELDLSDNQIGNSVKTFSQALPTASLERLFLKNCGLHIDDALMLLLNMGDKSLLEHLDLSQNALNADDRRLAAAYLDSSLVSKAAPKVNSTLEVLNLNECRIDPYSCYLLFALINFKNLRQLELSGARFSKKSLGTLTNSTYLGHLETLNLTNIKYSCLGALKKFLLVESKVDIKLSLLMTQELADFLKYRHFVKDKYRALFQAYFAARTIVDCRPIQEEQDTNLAVMPIELKELILKFQKDLYLNENNLKVIWQIARNWRAKQPMNESTHHPEDSVAAPAASVVEKVALADSKSSECKNENKIYNLTDYAKYSFLKRVGGAHKELQKDYGQFKKDLETSETRSGIANGMFK